MKKISVVVPCYYFAQALKELLEALCYQTILPHEVVIIDSTPTSELKAVLAGFEKKLRFVYNNEKQCFPGEARNKGVLLSSGDVIAFLDSKTTPRKTWLEQGVRYLASHQECVFFGKTQYVAHNRFQDYLQACTYGLKPVETSPGSILMRSTFEKVGGFIEGVRTSDDLEWRDRIKLRGIAYKSPEKATLEYHHISNSLAQEAKRHFVYQLHAAKVAVQLKAKSLVLMSVIIFLTLLLVKWNALVGWDHSPFYIPDVLKKTSLLCLSVSGLYLFMAHFILKAYNPWILRSIFVSSLILMFGLANNWNAYMAKWLEDSVFYIPHITKLYLGLLMFLGIVYRGFVVPLKKSVSLGFLLPFRWLALSGIGMILDVAKFPGYLYGGVLLLILPFRKKKR